MIRSVGSDTHGIPFVFGVAEKWQNNATAASWSTQNKTVLGAPRIDHLRVSLAHLPPTVHRFIILSSWLYRRRSWGIAKSSRAKRVGPDSRSQASAILPIGLLWACGECRRGSLRASMGCVAISDSLVIPRQSTTIPVLERSQGREHPLPYRATAPRP